MSKTRLVFLPSSVGDPAPFLTFDEGRVVARGALRLGDPAPTDPARTVVVAPGTEVAEHRLELPVRTVRQASAAAAVLLEDRLANRGTEPHVALGPTTADGLRSVFVVEAERMRRWTDQAAALGLRPDALVPDYALLPEPEGDETIAALVGERVAFRRRDRAGSTEPDLAPVLLGDVAAPLDGEERDRLVGRGLDTLAADLLQGPFDPRRADGPAWKRWRLSAALAAALLLSPLLLTAAEIVRHRTAAAEMDRRADALAAELAPNVRPGSPPDERMRQRLSDLRRGERFVPATAALFTALEQTPGAALMSLLYGEDGAVRATVSHPNYSDVEAMRQAVAEAGFALREDATVTEAGRVLTDVVLEPRP
jgi:general secretion pathway protein L